MAGGAGGVDAWMAIRGKVYNVTPYARYHPGGVAELARAAGDDGSTLFEEIHPWVSEGMLDKCEIGWLVQPSGTDVPKPQPHRSMLGNLGRRLVGKKSSSTQSPSGDEMVTEEGSVGYSNKWFDCSVAETRIASCRYCLIVRLECKSLGDDYKTFLEPGTFVKLRTKIGGKVFERPFTPFLSFSEKVDGSLGNMLGLDPAGTVDLLLKVYADGHVTKILNQVDLKDTKLELQVRKSPLHLKALADSKLTLNVLGSHGERKVENGDVDAICMIASGTGIMPMVQIIDYAIKGNSAVKLSLICANKTQKDIPFKEELAKLQNNGTLQSVLHMLSQETDMENAKLGRVDATIITKHVAETFSTSPKQELSKSKPTIRFVVCGHFEFNEHISQALIKSGWPSSAVLCLD
eukprot:CAMPEP_0203783934 /NCGR_PEP_ID=MMETSP0100_2-20121128/189_1 /ASSEMBLY_ACC=CAM_ASM_000210 /TAXON_ID=96639 /ORGANISM=" , Strain NY0313808BC1" /LENGTH=404 /DNA_ID=CAMNT_0050685865 /DNA_START=1195 /DNA_END=2408 /DNA_ORIENTATION=+